MAIEMNPANAQVERTAVAIYRTEADLVQAVRELHRLGFGNNDISVLAKDRNAVARTVAAEGCVDGLLSDAPASVAHESEPKGRDEAVGMAVGGAVGVLIGLGAVIIPGFGPFLLAAGPLAIALHGLTVGAAGMGMGALLGAIMDESVTEDHRDMYERELEAGHWMLVVHGPATQIERAAEALKVTSVHQIDTF